MNMHGVRVSAVTLHHKALQWHLTQRQLRWWGGAALPQSLCCTVLATWRSNPGSFPVHDAGVVLAQAVQRLPRSSRIMVFCNTLDSCRATEHHLAEAGLPTLAYHGAPPPLAPSVLCGGAPGQL